MLSPTALYDTCAALARIATVMEISDGRKPRELMQADLEQLVSMSPIIEITFSELCSIVGIKKGLNWPPASVAEWFTTWRLINAAAKSSPKEVEAVWSFCCGTEPAIMMGTPEETIPLFRAKLSDIGMSLRESDQVIDLLQSDSLDTRSKAGERVKAWLQYNSDRSRLAVDQTTVLFVAADPTNASRLRLSEEFREIQEKLKLAQLRDHFRLELPQLSVRSSDITQALLDARPQIVHISGHGTSAGALCFENQLGQIQLVKPDALAALFEQFANHLGCVLLNACYSATQARAIAEHIEYVIGMNQAIGERAAIAFSIGFYQALGGGRTIEDAYKLGCIQIRLQDIPEHLTPVLVKKG